MITCKEIDEYVKHARAHPDWINTERKLLIKNIVMPTLRRDDVFFDEIRYQKCINIAKSITINCFHTKNLYMLSHLCIKTIFRFFQQFL